MEGIINIKLTERLLSSKLQQVFSAVARLRCWEETWCEELTPWKRPWCWETLKAEGEGDDRGWDGCMASLTGWTWIWGSSPSWWWTGKPGVLQSIGLQRVIHDWATELNLTSMGSLSLLLSNHPHLLPPDGRPSAYPECTIQGWWVSRNQILASVLFWPCTNHPNAIFWAHLQRGKSKNWNSTNVTLLHSDLLGSGKVKVYLNK